MNFLVTDDYDALAYPDYDCDYDEAYEASDSSSDSTDDEPDLCGPFEEKVSTQNPASAVDPIVNPGGLLVGKIVAAYKKRFSPNFLSYALQLITNFRLPPDTKLPPRTIIPSRLPDQAAADIQALLSHGEKDRLILFMSIFLVKKPGGLHRVIGHPKQLNELLAPRRLQLSRLNDVLWACNLFDNIYATEMDLKNYFPQIPISGALSMYMGVLLNGNFSKHVVLTQGWNHSTIIAQSLSWALIAYCANDNDNPKLDLPDEESPPAFLVVKNGDGTPSAVIFVQSDNFLVITGNLDTHTKWRDKIMRNCRYFNCIVKYGNESHNHFAFCGVEFFKHSDGRVFRRAELERFTECKARRYNKVSASSTSAMVQILLRQGQLCGCFPSSVGPGPLLSISSRLGQRMAGKNKKQWKASNPEMLVLHEEVSNLFSKIANPWFSSKPRVITNVLHIVTDARPHITAWVIFNASGDVIHADTRLLTPIEEISVAETLAVKYAWADCRKRRFFANVSYVITGVDNTVASRCIAKGFSCSRDLDPHVQETYGTLPRATQALLVDLESKFNLADVPTRSAWSLELLNSPQFAVLRNISFAALVGAVKYFSSNSTDMTWMSRSAVAAMIGTEMRNAAYLSSAQRNDNCTV